jgi:hypothetical protein
MFPKRTFFHAIPGLNNNQFIRFSILTVGTLMVSSESAHGPLTFAENFPRLLSNAAVRSRTVPVT